MIRAIFALGLLLAATPCLHAHGIVADMRHRNGQLLVRVCYDDNSPIAAASVRFDLDPPMTGTTNDIGEVTFAMPKPGSIWYSVDAGNGHVLKQTVDIPLGPWQEDQHFTLGVLIHSTWTQQIGRLASGLIIIAIIAAIVMKLLPRRQSS